MQTQGSSSRSIIPCYDGRTLKGVHKVAKNGLSAISIKQTHRSCKFSVDPNTNLPLISCAEGFKARNSFRSIHKPDLRKVRGLECSTAESITQLLIAHNEDNAGKPTSKKKILRLLESLKTKKSRSSTYNNCLLLGEQQPWSINHCVLSSICQETEINKNGIVGSQDLSSEMDLSVGKEIKSSQQPTNVSNIPSNDILMVKKEGGSLDVDNDLSTVNLSNGPCGSGNFKFENIGTNVSKSPCTMIKSIEEVTTESDHDINPINKNEESSFDTHLTKHLTKIQNDIVINKKDSQKDIAADNEVVCESQNSLDNYSANPSTVIFQAKSNERVKDTVDCEYKSEVDTNNFVEDMQEKEEKNSKSKNNTCYCPVKLSNKIVGTISYEAINASQEAEENTSNSPKSHSNLFTEAIKDKTNIMLKDTQKIEEHTYEHPSKEVFKTISKEMLRNMQEIEENISKLANKTDRILENLSTKVIIKMPSNVVLKNMQETEKAHYSKSNSNTHSPANNCTVGEAESTEISKGVQEIELYTSKTGGSTNDPANTHIKVLNLEISRDVQEIEEYLSESAGCKENSTANTSTEEAQPTFNEMMKGMQEIEDYIRSHIPSLLFPEEQLENDFTLERCSTENTELDGGTKHSAQLDTQPLICEMVSKEDIKTSGQVNNKETRFNTFKKREEDSVVCVGEYEESKSVSKKDSLLNVSHRSFSTSSITGYCFWDDETDPGSVEIEKPTNQYLLLSDTQEKADRDSTALISSIFMEDIWKKWVDKQNLSTESDERYEFYNIPEDQPEYCYWTSMYNQNILDEAQNIVDAVDFFYIGSVLGEQSTRYGHIPCSVKEIDNDDEYEENQFSNKTETGIAYLNRDGSIFKPGENRTNVNIRESQLISTPNSKSKTDFGNINNISQTYLQSNFELNLHTNFKSGASKGPNLNTPPEHKSNTINILEKGQKCFQSSEGFLDLKNVISSTLENPTMYEMKSGSDEAEVCAVNPAAVGNKSNENNEHTHHNLSEYNIDGNDKCNLLTNTGRVSSKTIIHHVPSYDDENQSDPHNISSHSFSK